MGRTRLAVPYVQHVDSIWRGRRVTTVHTELSPVSEKVMWSHGGRKYHRQGCQAHYHGKSLWDIDDWLGYQVEYGTLDDATMRGKLPCLVCKPEIGFPPLFRQNFGHRPVNEYEGTPFRAIHTVCSRCVVWKEPWNVNGKRLQIGVRVEWPCMSAKVLGVV